MPQVFCLVGNYFAMQSMITMMFIGPVMAAQMACSCVPGWCGGTKSAPARPTAEQMAPYTAANHPCKGERVVA